MKERLQEARELITEIEQLKEERKSNKVFMVEYVPYFERKLRNGARDDIIIDYMKYDTRLKNEVQKLTKTVESVKECITSLKDNKLRELMRLYYIEGNTWEQVADIMCYDVRWIYKLHNRALTALSAADTRRSG